MSKRKEKLEMVDVALKIPKAIIDFLRDMEQNPEEYIVNAVVHDIESGLEADSWAKPKRLVKKYNLMPIFEKHNCLASDYVNPEEKDC